MRQQSQRAAAPQTAVAVPRPALYWKSGPPDSHAAFSAALLWFAGLVGNGQHRLFVVFVACAPAASGALGPLWLEHTCSSVNHSLDQNNGCETSGKIERLVERSQYQQTVAVTEARIERESRAQACKYAVNNKQVRSALRPLRFCPYHVFDA